LLGYSLPLNRFGLPRVFSYGCGFSVAAGGAAFVADVVGASSAASAAYMHDFALAFAH